MNAAAIYDALNPTEKEKTETKNKPKWTDGAVNSKGRKLQLGTVMNQFTESR